MSEEAEEDVSSSSTKLSEEDKSETLKCYVCGRQFGAVRALYGHLRCHPEREWRGVRPLMQEGEEGSSKVRRRKRNRIEEDQRSAEEYACGGCSKVFATRQALGGHRASHRGVMGCSAKAKAVILTEEKGRGGGQKFIRVCCQVCGKQFLTYHGMRVHQRVHRGKQKRTAFIVDLNLPPPPDVEEEEEEEEEENQGDED